MMPGARFMHSENKLKIINPENNSNAKDDLEV
jgi:hypothetical protein